MNDKNASNCIRYNVNHLREESRVIYEGQLTVADCQAVVNEISTGKSPNNDGHNKGILCQILGHCI